MQITCQVILPNRQRKRVLLLTQSPDWLMLVTPPLNRMHQRATIELVHPINKQEAFFKREDPRVIYLILTSTTCPGDTCAPVRDQPRNKWSLILYFDGGSTSASIDKAKNDAFKAMEFLEMNRKRTRDSVFHKVGSYFDWVPEPDPFLQEMRGETPKKAEKNLAPAENQDVPLPPDSFDEPPELLNADPDPSILTKIEKPRIVEEVVEDTNAKSEEAQNVSEDAAKEAVDEENVEEEVQAAEEETTLDLPAVKVEQKPAESLEVQSEQFELENDNASVVSHATTSTTKQSR